MEIERVDVFGVMANEDEIGFKLGWTDGAGYFGQIEFAQEFITGKITINSECTGKEFVLKILNALVEQSELSD